MPSREFTEWSILEEKDPWGQRRADWLVGALMAQIANAFRDPKQRSRSWEPSDFLPEWRWEEGPMAFADPTADPMALEQQAQENRARELAAKVGRINALLGGEDRTH